MISGKIILTKKSGPGELVGETELELKNEKVIFDKIQFTQEGEYVLLISSNNESLNNQEITIKVESETIISQEDSAEVVEKVEGNRPIISQIHKPTVNIPPMEFDISDNDEDNANVGGTLGYTPFVWYNGYQIRTMDIKSFKLYQAGIVPVCEMVISDSMGYLNEDETMPLGDTKFEIFLNSGSDVLKSIHLRFKLLNNKTNKNGTNTLTGSLDISDLYLNSYKSHSGSSFDVLRKISKEMGLGFNSNISNTNDDMIWRKKGTDYIDFISDVIEHSYISDDSFVLGYIDYYYCFNYVDIEKEWKRDISNDIGVISQGVSSKVGNEEDRIVSLELTNDNTADSTPFYFRESNLVNRSTVNSISSGSRTIVRYYDEKTKSFLEFEIDSQKSDVNKVVVLEGSPGAEDMNVKYIYGGKIDTDNTHKNYFYAKALNDRNIRNITNISMNITFDQPNFNLYIYQKVKVNFIKQNPRADHEDTQRGIINERLTGDWLITDISYHWNGSSLHQSMIITRKELGKTEEEIITQKTESKTDVNNSEVNENPSKLTNSNYFKGDMYLVRDKNGDEYRVTIVESPQNDEDNVMASIEKI